MTVVLSFIVQYYYYLTFVFVCSFQPFDAFVTSVLKSCNTANIYSCRPIIVAVCVFSLEKEPCGNKCWKYLLALALCDPVCKNLLGYYIADTKWLTFAPNCFQDSLPPKLQFSYYRPRSYKCFYFHDYRPTRYICVYF